jgi:endonuclease/exonuclease/phosphatase family metal-dependent hydrolase
MMRVTEDYSIPTKFVVMTDETKPIKKSRTNWFVMLCNWAAIVALLLSYLSAHIAPSSIGYLALAGLAYPFILLLNILFLIYWLFKKRSNALYTLGAILIGFTHLSDFFQISFPDKENASNTMKVLTYNVRLFDLYTSKTPKVTRNKIFELLKREKADVICFQEFYQNEKEGYFETKDTLLRILPNKHYHERFTHALAGQQYFGVTIFSKYPMIKKGYVPFANDPNNFCIYADLQVGEDTIRVYNAHLQSIRFKPEDYALVDGNKNNEEIEEGSKRIASRLKRAFIKREEQVNRVIESVKSCPHEVVLCGDFNDTPVSYTYETLTDELVDSFIEAGNGIGNTYIGVFPSFRIDYIMHSKGLASTSYETIDEKLSDHHAVSSVIGKKKIKN